MQKSSWLAPLRFLILQVLSAESGPDSCAVNCHQSCRTNSKRHERTEPERNVATLAQKSRDRRRGCLRLCGTQHTCIRCRFPVQVTSQQIEDLEIHARTVSSQKRRRCSVEVDRIRAAKVGRWTNSILSPSSFIFGLS